MRITALLAALVLALAACGTAEVSTTTDAPATVTTDAVVAATTTTLEATTTTLGEFPVTVEAGNGPVTIEERPNAVISLSPTATEMLFAIGAGEQVIAVDDQSNYPAEAPVTDLSGFTPNLEAILAFEPDLVVISFDPGDPPLSEGLAAAGIPTLLLGAATTLDDFYRQIEILGTATGNSGGAEALNEQVQADIAAIVGEVAGIAEGITYYHELSSDLYSATSNTFIGQVYGLLGLVNIADAADEDGYGFPQLTPEYVVAADPDIIFLADASYGVTVDSLRERPGWEGMRALESGSVVPLDADVASRWGPRIVEFLEVVAEAVEKYLAADSG
ncbi:MAG: ABC transporter substrate-binding protein [Acidimicrobiia bacterium]